MIAEVLTWYERSARDFPWRAPDRTPWGVLVCEVMSQQTPAARIVEPWRRWTARWPEPAALAAEAPGEAVRMWGRLGYPRRALRLHAAAVAVTERHCGQVPAAVPELRALPGVGDYTAAATAAFGHGVRVAVLDVNVRRVLARTAGDADPGPSAPTRHERERAQALLPADPATATRWNAAVMELGALVCTARRPSCGTCPLSRRCPGPRPATGRTTRAQPWHGSDRHVRGLVMALARDAEGAVPTATIDTVWPDRVQLARCVDGLVTDGLLEPVGGGLRLPAGA
ncbi:MAG: A/G-specific adenine glycosylase [Kineosporiaceae bacterium]